MDAEPEVEYRDDPEYTPMYRETDDGQTLSGALAPEYRGPGWLPGNPNWFHLY